jgi:RNA ligase
VPAAPQEDFIMGASNDDFTKYPRTPHLFGSRGTDDDKHLGQAESLAMIADRSLIVEEKLDGTNVGIHFTTSGRLVLQCRGHEITPGMHAQYDLFKQWTTTKRDVFEPILENRLILFGEWLYARHSVHYRRLPHYFFEFDIYDKRHEAFLTLESRLAILEGTGICTVPVVHRGPASHEQLVEMIGPSRFDSTFENPLTGRTDHLMEGLYLRTEANGRVSARSKLVRPEFVERVKQSEHWQHQAVVPNLLSETADIWS